MRKSNTIYKQRFQILEGIKNNIFKRKHVEEIAAKRLELCKACDFLDLKGDSCIVPSTQPCCKECGCSLKLKVRSLSSFCPINKWTSIVDDDDEELIENYLKKEK